MVRRMPYYRGNPDEVLTCGRQDLVSKQRHPVRTRLEGPSFVQAESPEIRKQTTSRPMCRRARAARLGALGIAAGVAVLLGGCALYHPLPLAHGPDLAGQLSSLRTQVPATR